MAGVANPDLPEQATAAYTAGGMRPFFDRGIGRMPDVGAGPVVKGAGRILGRGGPYANRIHVHAWYLIGPSEGRHGEGCSPIFAIRPSRRWLWTPCIAARTAAY